jgi:hypothetical protein
MIAMVPYDALLIMMLVGERLAPRLDRPNAPLGERSWLTSQRLFTGVECPQYMPFSQ